MIHEPADRPPGTAAPPQRNSYRIAAEAALRRSHLTTSMRGTVLAAIEGGNWQTGYYTLGQAGLIQRSGHDRKTVMRHLPVLTAAGWLTPVKDDTGRPRKRGRQAVVYRVKIPAGCMLAGCWRCGRAPSPARRFKSQSWDLNTADLSPNFPVDHGSDLRR